MHSWVTRRADYNFAREPHSRSDEPEFPVPMSRLVQVHEAHVDRGPRELFIELRVQVEIRLNKRSQPPDPHASGGESVHPGDQADAIARSVGLQTQPLDGFAGSDYRLGDDLYGNERRCGKSPS